MNINQTYRVEIIHTMVNPMHSLTEENDGYVVWNRCMNSEVLGTQLSVDNYDSDFTDELIDENNHV